MKTGDFEKVFKLMESSFPQTEFRTYEKQKKLFLNPFYNMDITKNENDEIIAFIAFWRFKEFDFVEHLAVNPNCRGSGIGSKIMRNFINNSSGPVLLEIEVPHDEVSKRREIFYERLGFKINNYKYFQLPLRKGASVCEMKLLSYPDVLSFKDFEKFKDIIYTHVYS